MASSKDRVLTPKSCREVATGHWYKANISTRLIGITLLTSRQVDLESNVTYLDVRTQARSADGESIYLSYHGFLKIDEAVTKAMSWDKDAATTKSGDHEWFSAPRFETSIKALKWIETTMFVGQGHCVVEGDQLAAEYDIYKVIN